MKRKTTWHNEDIITEPLIDPLLDHIGLPAGLTREATKEGLAVLIKKGDFTMEYCENYAKGFFHGFIDGLRP